MFELLQHPVIGGVTLGLGLFAALYFFCFSKIPSTHSQQKALKKKLISRDFDCLADLVHFDGTRSDKNPDSMIFICVKGILLQILYFLLLN